MNKMADAIKRAWWYIFEESDEWEMIAKNKASGPRADRRMMFRLKKDWDKTREIFSDVEDFVLHMSWIPLVTSAPACLLKDLICVAMTQEISCEDCLTKAEKIREVINSEKAEDPDGDHDDDPREQEEIGHEDGPDPE